MILYAEVKSDRASKGQGGNKYIEVKLRVGSRDQSRVVGKISMLAKNDTYIIDWIDKLEKRTSLANGIIYEL
jgi:hypothetical protein